MKNLKMKKIAIVLFAVLMMLTISTKVLATDDLVNPINILVNAEATQQPTTTPETTTTPAPTTTETTPTNTQPSTLPQTGDASDYAIFLLVAVCVVVSIYAYKKVRDYNNI